MSRNAYTVEKKVSPRHRRVIKVCRTESERQRESKKRERREEREI